MTRVMPDHDEHALTVLFRQESGRLVAYLARLLGANDLQTAEDVVQDTLFTARLLRAILRPTKAHRGRLPVAAGHRDSESMRSAEVTVASMGDWSTTCASLSPRPGRPLSGVQSNGMVTQCPDWQA